MNAPWLQIDDLSLSFAGLTALDGVSLDVNAGELFAVIGPNGAGKTSLFNCICGLYRPQRGGIAFRGQPLLPLAAHARADLGLARMFQNVALFEHMTVLENLLVGCHHAVQSNWLVDMLWVGRARREELRLREHVEWTIDFLNLERYRKLPVVILPYGVRKRVELGRALVMQPKLLLLDEPAAGLNQEETEDLARYLLDIKEDLGITQVLIEHDMGFVMDLADRIVVLDFGRKIAEGTPAEVRANPAVVAAYLGRERADQVAS